MGCIMSRCQNCNVEIWDHSDYCPLCKCVLEGGGGDQAASYPNARVAIRRFRLLENLILFASIVVESVLVLINYWTDTHILWSLIAGLVLFYGNVVLRLAVVGRSGYLFKSLSLIFIGVLTLLGIDYLTGYGGWSLDYVLPSGILFMDLGIIVLMIVNRRNWQSYMMVQILAILVSILPLVLLALGIIRFPYLAVIAMLVSVLLFLGTLIIGDRRARTELKRRFHL